MSRSRSIADVVFQLKSLREDGHLQDLMDVHGILEVKKIANLSSLKPILGQEASTTYGFKATKRKFKIEVNSNPSQTTLIQFSYISMPNAETSSAAVGGSGKNSRQQQRRRIQNGLRLDQQVQPGFLTTTLTTRIIIRIIIHSKEIVLFFPVCNTRALVHTSDPPRSFISFTNHKTLLNDYKFN